LHQFRRNEALSFGSLEQEPLKGSEMLLNQKEIRFQAEKFLDYFGKLQSAKVTEVFDRWAESKDFEPSDRQVIWREVETLLKKQQKTK
jgi:hypothetical protein